MNKKLGWIAALLLALGLLVWTFMPRPVEVELATVTQGRFERAVQEDGKARVRERYVVSTPLAARLARMDLKQGDTVARGATVATLWPLAPALLDARTRAEQQARIGALQATVARTQANVARARVALAQARTELGRSQTLVHSGFISPAQHDNAQLDARLREQELESARQEESAARHELTLARIALQPAALGAPAQAAWLIRAPVAGKVLKLYQQSEGTLPAGSPLLELGDPTQLEVVADILTEDAAQIAPGTPVQLSHWGGPQTLAGRVRLIESAAFTKVSALGVEEQRVNVVIDVATPPEQRAALADGFKVSVRMLVEAADNAIQVPVGALFPVGARAALFVVEQGRARQREVQVAARNGVQAWVTAGLTAGMQVVVYPPASLQDGSRIQRTR